MLSKRDAIHKTAWTMSDFGTPLAWFAIGDVGLGMLLHGAISLGAVASGPVGWTLLVAGTAWNLYEVFKNSDERLDELLERIDDLDYEGTSVEADVKEWIKQLTAFDGDLKNTPISVADQKERVANMIKKVRTYKKIVDYLQMMQKDFVAIKPQLKDWGFDKSQFEYSLGNVLKTMQEALSTIDKSMKEASKELVKQNPKVYTALSQKIFDLTKEITEVWGKPVFTEEEQKLLDLANRTVNGDVDIGELEDNQIAMTQLQQDLTRLLQQAKQQANKYSKGLSKRDGLEKIGVSLPEKPTANISQRRPEQMRGTKPAPAGTRTGPRLRSMPVVEQLQRSLNHLRVAANVENMPALDEDGMYGPQTASAVVALLQKFPYLNDHLRNQGVDTNRVNDVAFMNSDKTGGLRSLTKLSLTMQAMVQKLTSYQQPTGTAPVAPAQPGISQRDQQAPQAGACNLDTPNPNSTTVINCLRAKQMGVPAPYTNMYDFMRAMGMTDDKMIRMILDLFGGSRPRTWGGETIAREVRRQYGA